MDIELQREKKRKLEEAEAAKEQEDEHELQTEVRNNTSHNNTCRDKKEHSAHQLAKYAATKQRETERALDESRLSKIKWKPIHIQINLTNEENGELGMMDSSVYHKKTKQQIFQKIGSLLHVLEKNSMDAKIVTSKSSQTVTLATCTRL